MEILYVPIVFILICCIRLYTWSLEYISFYGTILDDYPLPLKETKFNINRSTDIATDTYGVKYQIIWD